jgi:hypothetical protein
MRRDQHPLARQRIVAPVRMRAEPGSGDVRHSCLAGFHLNSSPGSGMQAVDGRAGSVYDLGKASWLGAP